MTVADDRPACAADTTDDALLSSAVSAEARFLIRAGQAIASGRSLRELAEDLLRESLSATAAGYACLLCLRPVIEHLPMLEVVATMACRSPGRFLPLRDTLNNRRPDGLAQRAFATGEAVLADDVDGSVPTNLPGGHPPLRNFLLLADTEDPQQTERYLLCLANARPGFSSASVTDLRGMLNLYHGFVSHIPPDATASSLAPGAASPTERQQRAYITLSNLAPLGVLELDTNWLCVRCNTRWCEMSRLSQTQSHGTGWVDVLHTADVYPTLVSMRETLAQSRVFRRELRLRNPSCTASSQWVELSATVMLDARSRVCGTLIVILDTTLRRQAENSLRQVAHYDSLTGLMNRYFFRRQLDAMLESGRGELALLHLDLDGFKQVNDTFGHALGDILLQQIAHKISASVRELDLVARQGGDEFSIVLTPMRDTAAVGNVAEKILQQVANPCRTDGHELRVTTSIGIAVGTCGITRSATLMRQADSALRRAKTKGGSHYLFHSADLEQAQRKRSDLLQSLRLAVEQQAFALHYQPQLRIRDQKLLGFEALLRWPQAEGQTAAPEVFIDLLEQTDLLDRTGLWVIEQACRQHLTWCASQLIPADSTMSVNVSATQLRHPEFVTRLRTLLERLGMPPAQLILEITESALVQAAESRVIEHIRQMGVLISLDDFGTGYSSLAYLSELPVDHLKIDRSFILAADTSRRAMNIVKSIIALARTLGITVIAEGVENDRLLPLLASEGCEAWQGYFSSPAVAADAVAGLIDRLRGTRLFDASAHLAD